MQKFYYKILIFSLLTASSNILALGIDEKVLGRILGVSDTKRTVLVNRGEEHALKVGDHAKFSTPQEGYFARGVVVRVSPTRSVWSIYRFLKKSAVRENLVATIKISTAIEITEDASKDLGVLGTTYEKRVNKKIPREQKQAARGEISAYQLEDHIIKGKRRESLIRNGVDFSVLNSDGEPQRPQTIDWRALDEKRPSYSEKSDIDFSSLRRRNE